MLPLLQSLVGKDIIKVLDDGIPTIPACLGSNGMFFLFEHSNEASEFGYIAQGSLA